jgi:hypothetical protein
MVFYTRDGQITCVLDYSSSRSSSLKVFQGLIEMDMIHGYIIYR